jgi:HlyD family secretion protein
MAKKGGGWMKWVLVLIGLTGLAFFYKRWSGPGAVALSYRTSTVELGDVRQVVTASGTLEPVVFVEVGTEISGTLREIFVDFNSIVTNGQILARIDPRSYDNSLKQAEAELASAMASLELARVTARRAEQLHSKELTSDAEYDLAIADLHRAEATAQIREATRDKNKIDLDRTTIYSPIDGMVISRNVEVGQTVAASLNSPTLFMIANDLSKMHIHASISEADVGGVTEGQKVEFTVDAFAAMKLFGDVHQVRNAPVTNQNVVSYTSVIAVDNPDSKLKPGMTANVTVTVAEKLGVLKVPNAAFRFKPAPEGGAPGGAPSMGGEGGPRRGGPAGGGAPGGGGGERGGGGRGQFGGGGGGGGGPGMMGQRRGGRGNSLSAERNLYLLVNETDPSGKPVETLKPVKVKAGITDGAFTEILSGLSVGDKVVIGTETLAAGATPGANNPFAPGFGRRGR